MPGEQSVILTLSGDEALVLFDWLARSSDTGVPAPFVDQAEARVLWHVEAVLERSLVAPFPRRLRVPPQRGPQGRSR